MTEEKKQTEEKRQKSFGIQECGMCDVSAHDLGFHQDRLWNVLLFLAVAAIPSGIALMGSENNLTWGLGLLMVFVACFLGWIPVRASVIGCSVYLLEHNGQTHCHSTAPNLRYFNKWFAVVWDEATKELVEVEITSPIIRLAFGGWFRTSKILNGWSHVKIGRPFVKTFDNDRHELFVTVSHRDDYGAGPRFREALVVNQYEVMDLVKRITASELQVTRMVFRTLQNTERALDLSDRVVERMTGQFTVMSKAHEQLREEGNEAYQKFLRADSDAGALFERVRQITAGMARSKRVNNSPIAGIAREALETMLEVICAEGAEEPVKESKERIQMLLEKMGDLPEPLRQQGVPAGKVAAQK